MFCGSYGMANTNLQGNFKDGMRQGNVDGINVVEFELPYSNYYSLMRRSLVFISFAVKSVRAALKMDYDIIFATSTPLTAGIPGIFARLIRRKPFVFEVRDLWPELPREMGVIKNPFILKALDWLEWVSYHSASGHIGLSPGIVKGIQKRKIPSQSTCMIPNGCDIALFKNSERVRAAGISEKDLVAVFTGAHGVANGLDSVLNAAAELKKRGRKDIWLVFIGDGKLKPALKERAENDKLDNTVFLDPVPRKKLACLLRGADVGMQILANIPAFYYGTSPNKFFDYIASGLPVINNYPGWLAELIVENKCGIAVAPDNPSAFADGLEFLAEKKDRLAEMGKNSLELAEKKFNRQDLANKFVSFLEERANR